MLQSIWEDVKKEFNHGNMVTRIIIANIIVFVAINLIWIFLRIGNGWQTPELYYSIRNFFMISSDWLHNLTHPWVLITSMFLHEGFWHILWNMLFLYWFGRIVGGFIGDRHVLPLYLLGGIVGGLAYFISINLLPYGGGVTHYALGASGAVMAFVVGAGTISPNYEVRLFFLGIVKLKFIVAALVFIDLVGMAGDINTGGHFAHLGGAVFGWLYVRQLREGVDWSQPVNRILDRINNFFDGLKSEKVKPKRGPRVVYKNVSKTRSSRKGHSVSDSDYNDMSHQEQLDAILDKIKKTGYESLSEEEKEFLFKASKK